MYSVNFSIRFITLNSTINWQNWAISVPANAWTSIGTSTKAFSGTFDGSGFVINGVYINSASSEQSLGLFGYVSSSETIKNLGVTASYIKGKALRMFCHKRSLFSISSYY
jgi:hypothetical protein